MRLDTRNNDFGGWTVLRVREPLREGKDCIW